MEDLDFLDSIWDYPELWFGEEVGECVVVSVECLRFERELSNPWETNRLVVVERVAEVREEQAWRRNVTGD